MAIILKTFSFIGSKNNFLKIIFKKILKFFITLNYVMVDIKKLLKICDFQKSSSKFPSLFIVLKH